MAWVLFSLLYSSCSFFILINSLYTCFHPLAQESLYSKIPHNTHKPVLRLPGFLFPTANTLFHQSVYTEFNLAIDSGVYDNYPVKAGNLPQQSIESQFPTEDFELLYHIKLATSEKNYLFGVGDQASCSHTIPLILPHYSRVNLSKPLRPAVCGDGIIGPGETCEFSIQTSTSTQSHILPQDIMLTPPSGYGCPYGENKGCWKNCRWGPLEPNSCNPGLETAPQFLHYCGNGVVEMENNPEQFSVSLLRFQGLTPNALICGYEDPFMTIPIFCNYASESPGRYFEFIDNSHEECDLGGMLNHQESSGCTPDCKLKCIHGYPNYEIWPELPCQQPCLKKGFSGPYCNIPLCQNGVTNWTDGSCISCHPGKGYKLPYCVSDCSGHGEFLMDKKICNCTPGWMGPHCEQSTCIVRNEDHAIGMTSCLQCAPGWTGPYCTETLCVHGYPSETNDRCICHHPIFHGDLCEISGCYKVILLDQLRREEIKKPLSHLEDYSLLSCLESSCLPGWKGDFCEIHIDDSISTNLSCNLLAGDIDPTSPIGSCYLPCLKNTLYRGLFCHETNGIFLDIDYKGVTKTSWSLSCTNGYKGPFCLPEHFRDKNNCQLGKIGQFCDISICLDEKIKEGQNLQYKFHLFSLSSSIDIGKGKCLLGCNLEAVALMRDPELMKYWCGSVEVKNCLINGVGSISKTSGCFGCKKGYYGPWCTESGCLDPLCTECLFQHWGTFCTLRSNCVPNHTSSVERETGKCICKDGWNGENCSISSCINGNIDLILGHCSSCFPGWIGEDCSVPKCQHGYIQYSNGSRIDHFPINGRLIRHPQKLISVTTVKPEVKTIFSQWKNNISVKSISEGSCSACYDSSSTVSLVRNNPFCEYDDDNSLPCYHGHWDPLSGKCGPCFPGYFGSKCNSSNCLRWNLEYQYCEKCDNSFFGKLCHYKSRCIEGMPDNSSEVGTCRQSLPCLRNDTFGPYCQPKTSSVFKDEHDYHSVLYKGSYYQGTYSEFPLSICQPGWRGLKCNFLACEHGLVNLSHPQLYCFKASCTLGWYGEYCDQPLFKSFPKFNWSKSLENLDLIKWTFLLKQKSDEGIISFQLIRNRIYLIHQNIQKKEPVILPKTYSKDLLLWNAEIIRQHEFLLLYNEEEIECLHPGMGQLPYCNFSLCSRVGGFPISPVQVALKGANENFSGCKCLLGFSGPYCEIRDRLPNFHHHYRMLPDTMPQLINSLLEVGNSVLHSPDLLIILKQVDYLLNAITKKLEEQLDSYVPRDFISIKTILELVNDGAAQPLYTLKPNRKNNIEVNSIHILEKFIDMLKIIPRNAFEQTNVFAEKNFAELVDGERGNIWPLGFISLLRLLIFHRPRSLKKERTLFKIVEFLLIETLLFLDPSSKDRLFKFDSVNPNTNIMTIHPLRRCLPGGIRIERIDNVTSLYLMTVAVYRNKERTSEALISRHLTLPEIRLEYPNFNDLQLILKGSNEDDGQCSFCRQDFLGHTSVGFSELEVIKGTLKMPFCSILPRDEGLSNISNHFKKKNVVDEFLPLLSPSEVQHSSHECLEWDKDTCKKCPSGKYGPLCQWVSNCVHGKLDLESQDGRCSANCSPEHYFGLFCNETRCLQPPKPPGTQPDNCSYGCKDGWTMLPSLKSVLDISSPPMALGKYCDIPHCIHGIPDVVNGYCKLKSCSSKLWGGRACDQLNEHVCQEGRTIAPNTQIISEKIFLLPPWKSNFSSIDAKFQCEICPTNWTGPLCQLPFCIHGIPNYENGGCLQCHPGWLGEHCETPICQNGIYNPIFSQYLRGTNLFLGSEPRCLACFGDWLGPECTYSGCAGGVIDPMTQKCLQCPLGKYGPKCQRIAKCVHGTLDENSLDGSCIKGSCRIGKGRYCDSSACIHGQTDPRTLFCAYCYIGWTSSDISRPTCNIPDCQNGRLKMVGEHTFLCICEPGYQGVACDSKTSNSTFFDLCPLPKCDPILPLECYIPIDSNTTGSHGVIIRERKCIKPPVGFQHPDTINTTQQGTLFDWMKKFSLDAGESPLECYNPVLYGIIYFLLLILLMLILYICYLKRWKKLYSLPFRILGQILKYFTKYKKGKIHTINDVKKKLIRRNSISTPYQYSIKKQIHFD